MNWLQRLFHAQRTNTPISDDEIDAIRAGLGTHIRILENAQIPTDRMNALSTEAALVNIELACRLLDELRGLREDMAHYRNRDK